MKSPPRLRRGLTVLMAGRAAEQVVFGEPSTGAADDLAKATDLARDMVLRYGMDDTLGPVSWAGERPRFLPELGPVPSQPSTAAATAQQADDAVRTLVSAAMERAVSWLQSHRETLDRATLQLLQRETLGEEDLRALVGQPTMDNPRPISGR